MASSGALHSGPAYLSRRPVVALSSVFSRRCGRPSTVALAYPSSQTQQAETAERSRAASTAAVVIERPIQTCPFPRPDGYDTDGSPFNSVDLSFSPEVIDTAAGIDESELLTRIAQVSAAEEEGDAGGGAESSQPNGMNASLKGMLLLNLGAALFGSNMVRFKIAMYIS